MKIDESREILAAMGMPKPQQSDLCSYTFLALGNILESSKWEEASNEYFRIHDVIQFLSDNYGIEYAENSRETIRKKAMHSFRDAAIIENNGMSTNSPNYKYRLTDETLQLIKSFKSKNWENALNSFMNNHESLKDIYSNKRSISKMPIIIDKKEYTLSYGKHNLLQKLIIEEFASRFAQNTKVLYIGDTRDKYMYCQKSELERIGIKLTKHDKLPDVILYHEERKWIYFIEAVTSVGPISQKRINEIEELTKKSNCSNIYITAFLDIKTYKKFAAEIAWETEVWIANNPDHMIHLNGDKFLGPR